MVEQGQPLSGALFGDLALEHQLLDRAIYLEGLADAAGHGDTRLGEIGSQVQQVTDRAALAAPLRYERKNKDRVGATSAIENQLAALKAEASNRN